MFEKFLGEKKESEESCEVIKKSMTKCVNEKQGTFFCKEIVDKFDKLCKTDEEKEDEKKEDEKKEDEKKEE